MTCKTVDDDIIQKILANYIKHRNYKAANPSLKSNEPLDNKMAGNPENGTTSHTRDDNVLPAKDWFLEGALSAFQSIRNAATLRLKEEDFVKEVEVAFRKFVDFINAVRLAQIERLGGVPVSAGTIPFDRKVPQHGEELWMTCFPLFVHIFIQLFECGYISNAHHFFMEHYHRFTKKANHVQFLSSMQSSLNHKTLNPALQNFKNFKCRILITEESFNLLTQFLKHEQHLSILQTFNSCLDFRVMTQEEYRNQQAYLEPTNHIADGLSLLDEAIANPGNSPEMNEILQVIKSMRNSKEETDTNLPKKAAQTTICLCKIRSERMCSVAISKDLSKIVAGNEDSEIILWDCELTEDLQYFSSRASKHWKRIPVRQICSDVDFKFINSKRFGTEDEVEEDSDDDNNGKIRAKNGIEPIIFRGHSGPIYEMSFGFNSDLLLSCSGDTTIRSWDVNSGACLAIYKGHAHAIWTLDSNDSGSFISGGRDGVAMMWDVERTIPMRIYSGHLMDINQIKFHPNCNYLATASADKTIILWDVNQVRQVRMFCGHTGSINAIRFSSCGRYLTSASQDGSVRIWDISQGHCVLEMLDHHDDIRSIALGPEDKLLASCGAESSSVVIWEDPITGSRNQQQSPPFVSIDMNGTGNQNLMHIQFIRHNLLLAFSKI